MELIIGELIEWQRASAFGEIARLALDIREMDPRFRAEVRRVARSVDGDKEMTLPQVPGQALFSRLCSACHSIGMTSATVLQ